ncbi:sensor histidine kinase [Pyxidicoccus caerfyrddinensis]|uniref:sensor histidine kinase n=1 Tax=Pyxidicoccus caerfyrddinensis TaxID=2709663 RepID=UPI001F0871D2|nr:hypothetical protein [Pyxidicoccus caerfyrddinensis]
MNPDNFEDLLLTLSPYPVVRLSDVQLPVDGALVPAPPYCRKVFPLGKCQEHYKSLAASKETGTRTCPYGFLTQRTQIGDCEIALTALLTPEAEGYRKLKKDAPASNISAKLLEEKIRRFSDAANQLVRISRKGGNSYIEALHEVRRLNQTVKVIMERSVMALKEGRPVLQGDIVRAEKASEMMSLHMDALDLLANPSLLEKAPLRGFVLYQLVDKICHVYKPRADERRIGFLLTGKSFSAIKADDRTFYIIPSVLIDNAIKYGPPETMVEVRVFEGAMNNLPSVGFSVSSIGPPSSKAEEARMIRQRGRGQMAAASADGSGQGLYLAGLIARHHGASLSFTQRQVGVDRSEWEFRFETPVYTERQQAKAQKRK